MAAKHYGIHRAVVVNVDDPKQLDRIKVRVPEVLGNEITDWVWPKHPATFWSWKPIVGSPVWVEFEAGDVDRPLYSGTWYPQYEGSSTIPDESKAEYPFHRMIATPRGHKIEFKDISTQVNENTKSEEDIEDSTNYMRLSTPIPEGKPHGHIVELNNTKDSEHVSIQTVKGNTIGLSDVDGDERVFVETPGGHKIEMDDTNTTLTIAHSDNTTKIEIDSSGNVSIIANGNISLLGGGGLIPALGGVVCANTPSHPCVFSGGPHPGGSQHVEASQ